MTSLTSQGRHTGRTLGFTCAATTGYTPRKEVAGYKILGCDLPRSVEHSFHILAVVLAVVVVHLCTVWEELGYTLTSCFRATNSCTATVPHGTVCICYLRGLRSSKLNTIVRPHRAPLHLCTGWADMLRAGHNARAAKRRAARLQTRVALPRMDAAARTTGISRARGLRGAAYPGTPWIRIWVWILKIGRAHV